LEAIKKGISRIAKARPIAGACLYGSMVAGYARPSSDIDVLVVLEDYPYVVKYVYLKGEGKKEEEKKIDISALVVDKAALEKDARQGYLGEFVIGRLLHIYEPIENSEFFNNLDKVYKRRIILEEINDIVKSSNVLGTEILFPLEYVMFSKIKRRSALYPNAVYSYYKTYTGEHAPRNIEFALSGYKRALGDIIKEDTELFASSNGFLKISDMRVVINGKGERAYLMLTKRLQEFSSYFVHTYAGRETFHRAVKEAESKIRRHVTMPKLPDFMSNPKEIFWKLPEGLLIYEQESGRNAGGRGGKAQGMRRRGTNWLDVFAEKVGFSTTSSYTYNKRRLGNVSSKTFLITLFNDNVGSGGRKQKKIVVKELARSKSVKWATLNIWTSPVKRFKVDPGYRLASEYKALRYIRSLGLCSPLVESVVPDKRLLVTEFIEGVNLADVVRGQMTQPVRQEGAEEGRASLIKIAGRHIATVHKNGSTFGNIKPKNIIVGEKDQQLYFTDLEQFVIGSGDPLWDLAQFMGWGLKGRSNADAATRVARMFLEGYLEGGNADNIGRLARSKRHIESFYPVLVPSVARAIKREIRNCSAEFS